MKTHNTKMKGKKVLSMLLALVMVLSVASPAFSPMLGIIAKAATGDTIELAFDNIFVFEQWANHQSFAALNAVNGALITDDNTLIANIATGSFTLTNSISDPICTSFSAATADTHYTIPVEENTTYNFSYNLSGTATSVYAYVFYYDKDGNILKKENGDLDLDVSPNTSFIFTTRENTGYIGVRFDNNIGSSTATFSDIKICKSATVEGTVGGNKIPTRKTYTAGTGKYTDLPTPTKDGWFFKGWYTGENGSGELVTADTEVFGSSVTVYSMWEADVTSLSIVSEPTKKSYTLGEKVDAKGLVLQGSLADGSTIRIDSGFRCSPENVDAVGEQTITVNYGTKSVTFKVNVVSHINKTVTVAGVEQTVPVANNTYTLDHTAAEAFNRYELTYTSDSYVKGTITFGSGDSEDFFLEPSGSDNGSFVSYIDDFLTGKTQTNIASIKFTCLDNENGSFELLSVATGYEAAPGDTMQYYENGEYKVGIDLGMGGTLSYLQDLKNKPIAVDYSGTEGTKVDLEKNIDNIAEAEGVEREVNLINTFDKGRLVQQSYYGTDKYPFELGYYDGNDWRYNPVQGGNAPVYADDDKTVLRGDEASKIVDYRITDTEIYIKTRPLDWGKNSEDYPDSYNTPSYMESWYVFEDGMIKTYCRFVDYSGYPSSTYKQELPAFYCVEPLNYFAYSTGGDAWSSDNKITYKTGLDYWGKNGIDPNFNCNENWAAFMAGDKANSYGVGVYSADVSNFVAGVFPDKDTDYIVNDNNIANNHAKTIDPSSEVYTSYLAPSENMKFESYSPFEYSYYITTGTAKEIRGDFQAIAGVSVPTEIKECTIAVPETIYMTPSSGVSNSAQYFVNNNVDGTGNLSLDADNSEINGNISVYAPGSTAISFDVKAVSGGIGDPVIGGSSTDANSPYENNRWAHSVIYDVYKTGAKQDWFAFEQLKCYINGTGLAAGNTALIEWAVTVYYGDDDTTGITHYAYSTLYAPNHHSVGATAEARYNSSNRVDGAGWISGIHTVNTSLAPFGKNSGVDGQGAFKSEPLLDLSKPITPQDWGSANNLTSSSDGLVYAREFYKSSEGGSNEQSPTGILYVDYSRYKNTNTIPNVYVGSELLKADSGNNDDTHMYAYYTLGTGTEFVNPGDSATPSGWTQYVTLSSSGGYHNGTVASTLSSGTDLTNFVSILKDANSGRSLRIYTRPSLTIKESGTQYIYLHNQIRKNGSYYANMYVAVQIVTCNKSTLRELVLECTGLNEANYTTDSWSKFQTELRAAAEALGNPSNSDVTTTYNALVAARDALQTNVYLNANGGTINPTSFGVTIGKETIATADVSAYVPTKEGYTFAGWTAIEGATIGGTTETINVGFNQTLYAVWKANKYNLTFDNLIDLDAWKKLTPSNATATFSDTAITLTSNEGVGEGTFTSPFFDVTPGADYKIEMDFIGDNWDVYIFFCDANGSWVDFADGPTNRYSSNGSTGVPWDDAVFTAPEKAAVVKAQIRLDANGASNTVTFSNIRVYEDTGITVSPVNKYVEYGSAFGKLPTPVKEGRGFVGWKNTATDEMVTESTVMDGTETVNLESKWEAIHYTVNFSPNGAEGVQIPNICLSQGTTAFVLPQGPSCEDLEFLGWSTDQYATKAEYKAGQTINVNSLTFTEDKNNLGGVETTIHAVWKLKDSVVKDDTVITDFNQPVKISPYQMNDSGIVLYHADSMCDDWEVSLPNGGAGDYGDFKLNDDKYTFTYTPTKIMNGVDEVDVLLTLKYPSRTQTFTSKITVVPASNMLYEEGVINAGIQSATGWTLNEGNTDEPKLYDKDESLYNDEKVKGEITEAVYGYNSNYADSTGFSKDSYLKSVVTSSNKTGGTASFTFVGSGFDLISACGTNTGVQRVRIYKGSGSSKTLYGMYVVDTYFSDTDIMNNGLLHQVPVLQFRDSHGTYTVETTAIYLSSAGALKAQASAAYSKGTTTTSEGIKIETNSTSATDEMLKELGIEDVDCPVEFIWMDDNSVLNGGTGAKKALLSGFAGLYFAGDGTITTSTGLENYIDGVRIYNPLKGGSDYYKDSEQNPTYFNIVEELEWNSSERNMAYIEGSSLNFGEIALDPEAADKYNFNAYHENGGPKGEIYLNEGDAIAFKFKAESNGTASGIMLGMRAVKGTPTAKTIVGTIDDSELINSATEMYYEIATNVQVTTTGVTVIVTNPDDGKADTNNILAVNNLKLVNGPQNAADQVDNGLILGNTSTAPLAPTPVVPDSVQGEAGNAEDIPETDVDTETNVPETDTETEVEDNVDGETENNISVAIPGLPAPIASFLEMLFKFLGQLVGSLGF